MKGKRQRPRRTSGRFTGWMRQLHLTMPLGLLLAVIVALTMVTGMARAEFHQPYYQNGFGFDSQLPLMPNHHQMEDHLLQAATARTGPSGGNVDSGLVNAANALMGGSTGDVVQPVNQSYSAYLNRKEVLMPLIADLIRFHNLTNEVYEAYVLNVDQQNHGQMDRNSTRDDTAVGGGVVTSVVIDSPGAFQLGAVGGGGGSSSTGTGNSLLGEHSQEHLEQLLLLNDLSYFDLTTGGGDRREGAEDTGMSVLEQNLADLNDFCDNNNHLNSGSNNNNNNDNTGGGVGANSYYSFNNLSYNLIPKDLLEATDLFQPTAPVQALLSGRHATSGVRDALLIGSQTRGNDDGDDDPEDKKYLEYINKDGEEEEGDEKEQDQTEIVTAAAVKQELEEDTERLDLNEEKDNNSNNNENRNETEDEKITEGSTTASKDAVKEEKDAELQGELDEGVEIKEEFEDQEIITKLEQFEENDLIEELSEDSDEAYAEEDDVKFEENIDLDGEYHEEEVVIDGYVKYESEDEEEDEQKPVIFNVLDAVDDDQHEARDWFLNGNEVISARRSRSSTFDDIRIDEFSDEVISIMLFRRLWI